MSRRGWSSNRTGLGFWPGRDNRKKDKNMMTFESPRNVK